MSTASALSSARRRRAVCSKELSVDVRVHIFENIENHLLNRSLLLQESGHRAHGDLRGLVVREVELARGDAAEGHAVQPVFSSQRQAGLVAGSEIVAVARGDVPGDDRPDRVQHIPRRQVEARGDLGLAIGLGMALPSMISLHASRSCRPAAEWMALSMQPWQG